MKTMTIGRDDHGDNDHGDYDNGDDDHDDDDGGDCNRAAWGGLVVHIRHKLQCVRYTGVRALSGTISIGTLHNGAGGEEERDD